MATPSTLDSILERYRLKKRDLNQEINILNMERICRRSCTEWRSLPSLLGIDDYKVVVANIEGNYRKEEGKKLGFFEEWKKMKGFEATYEVLVGALLETRQREDAERVCEILEDSLPTPAKEMESEEKVAQNTVLIDPAATVKKHQYRLVESVIPQLEAVAAKLYDQNLINQDAVTAAGDTLVPVEDRAIALIEAVIDKIGSERKLFDILISVMRRIRPLATLADELTEAMKIRSSPTSVLTVRPHQAMHRLATPKKSAMMPEPDSGIAIERQNSSSGDDNVSLSELQDQIPGILDDCTEGDADVLYSLNDPSTPLTPSGKTFSYAVSGPPIEDSSHQPQNPDQGMQIYPKTLKTPPVVLISLNENRLASLADQFEEKDDQYESLVKSKVEKARVLKLAPQLERSQSFEEVEEQDAKISKVRSELGDLREEIHRAREKRKRNILKIKQYLEQHKKVEVEVAHDAPL